MQVRSEAKDYHARRRDELDGVALRKESIFGIETLKHEFWVEMFLFRHVFDHREITSVSFLTRPADHISLIDWNAYAVDLAHYKKFTEFGAHIESARSVAKDFGFDLVGNITAKPRASSLNFLSLARLLQLDDGCPLIAREQRFKDFSKELSRFRPSGMSTQSQTAKDVLARAWDEGEVSSKADALALINREFPKLSDRKTLTVWNAVAQSRPEMRRPGRKSTRRIDTKSN
jgi:hypothetical protein